MSFTKNQTIKWNSTKALQQNIVFGEKPVTQRVTVQEGAIKVNENYTTGSILYIYDFGSDGTIGVLKWVGDGLVKLRYKIADTRSLLNSTEFVGTIKEKFNGNAIDTSRFLIVSGDYTLSLIDFLRISGIETKKDFFVGKTALLTIDSNVEPFSAEVQMRLTKQQDSSGALCYLALTDGTNEVRVEKYYKKIKDSAKIIDGVAQSVNINEDNDALFRVIKNGVLFESHPIELTDGILEGFDTTPPPLVRSNTLIGLKKSCTFKNLEEGVQTLQEHNVTPLYICTDYNIEGGVENIKKGMFLFPKERDDLFAFRSQFVGRRVDFHSAQLDSKNLNPDTKQWETADKNDTWSTVVRLKPGTYRYKFVVDGEEVLDPNANNYMLDDDNNPQPLQGYGYGYGVGIVYSQIEVTKLQDVTFLYRGEADEVSLIGTFNSWNVEKNPMTVGLDEAEILKMTNSDSVYQNDNKDWHRFDITLSEKTSIAAIDFKTAVPLSKGQRVRIIFDDNIHLSQREWKLVTGRAVDSTLRGGLAFSYGYGYGDEAYGYGSSSYGYGYGATYGGYGEIGYGYGPSTYGYGTSYGLGYGEQTSCERDLTCEEQSKLYKSYSHWDNMTDTIVASEDDVVRWCIKSHLTRRVCKISFLTRLENGSNYQRKHIGLDIVVDPNDVEYATDYAVSKEIAFADLDNEVAFSSERGKWKIPRLPMTTGRFKLSSALEDYSFAGRERSAYGLNDVEIEQKNQFSTIRMINTSDFSVGDIELAYGASANLEDIPTKINSIIDSSRFSNDETYGASSQHNAHIVDRSVAKEANLLNVDMYPAIVFYAVIAGYKNKFRVFFYETKQDAINRTNEIGYVTSNGYGLRKPYQFTGLTDPQGRSNFFKLSRKIAYQDKLITVTVGTLVVNFEQGAADTIFIINPL